MGKKSTRVEETPQEAKEAGIASELGPTVADAASHDVSTLMQPVTGKLSPQSDGCSVVGRHPSVKSAQRLGALEDEDIQSLSQIGSWKSAVKVGNLDSSELHV